MPSCGLSSPSASRSAVHRRTNAWPTALRPVADYYFYIQQGTTAAVNTLSATFAMLNCMESFDRIRSRRRKKDPSCGKAVAAAVRKAGMAKPAIPDIFRHSLATHWLKNGYDRRTLPGRLGHKAVKTTRIYTPVRNRGGRGVRRLADTL